jgi:hypothetical protein
MSKRNKGRIGGPFVPMLKDTMKTEAWRALSYGSRALYMALKCRYNSKLQGSVYLSTRDAVKELSLHQCRTNILKWYHELQYYGFIVMVSLPHHGLNGHGKAAHYRLTEEWYLGKSPTRDYLNWDGELFHEQKSPKHYQRKNKSRGMYGHTTLECTGIPVADQSNPEMPESGMDGYAICEDSTGMDGDTITSSTTPYAACEPSIAPAAIPIANNPWPVYRAMRGFWDTEIYLGSIVRLCSAETEGAI